MKTFGVGNTKLESLCPCVMFNNNVDTIQSGSLQMSCLILVQIIAQGYNLEGKYF